MIADLQLSDIFRKIALYKPDSKDEQRGKSLFIDPGSQVFCRISAIDRSKMSAEDLKLIGYSLHKFVVEILLFNSSVFRLLPFHEQYCRSYLDKLSPYFYNALFKVFIEIKKTGVLSSNFYYFKKEDRIK